MPNINPIQMQKYLKGIDYPTTKEELIKNAKALGADEDVQSALEDLPDENFESLIDVSQSLSKDEGEAGGSANRPLGKPH